MLHDENLQAERLSFVTHLECAFTGERHAADEVHNLSRAGKPLLVRYDLAGVAKTLSKEALAFSRPFMLVEPSTTDTMRIPSRSADVTRQ